MRLRLFAKDLRAVSLAPEDFEIKSLRAWIDVYASGNFDRFHKLLAPASRELDTNPVAALARFNVQFFERRFEEALAALITAGEHARRNERATAESVSSRPDLPRDGR
ncbi:MAG: hypothetical protein M3505_09450 [Verrucomicrobiota bacterium]|nr:hypothetical protein [Verrucomicrobiota bacterium]